MEKIQEEREGGEEDELNEDIDIDIDTVLNKVQLLKNRLAQGRISNELRLQRNEEANLMIQQFGDVRMMERWRIRVMVDKKCRQIEKEVRAKVSREMEERRRIRNLLEQNRRTGKEEPPKVQQLLTKVDQLKKSLRDELDIRLERRMSQEPIEPWPEKIIRSKPNTAPVSIAVAQTAEPKKVRLPTVPPQNEETVDFSSSVRCPESQSIKTETTNIHPVITSHDAASSAPPTVGGMTGHLPAFPPLLSGPPPDESPKVASDKISESPKVLAVIKRAPKLNHALVSVSHRPPQGRAIRHLTANNLGGIHIQPSSTLEPKTTTLAKNPMPIIEFTHEERKPSECIEKEMEILAEKIAEKEATLITLDEDPIESNEEVVQPVKSDVCDSGLNVSGPSSTNMEPISRIDAVNPNSFPDTAEEFKDPVEFLPQTKRIEGGNTGVKPSDENPTANLKEVHKIETSVLPKSPDHSVLQVDTGEVEAQDEMSEFNNDEKAADEKSLEALEHVDHLSTILEVSESKSLDVKRELPEEVNEEETPKENEYPESNQSGAMDSSKIEHENDIIVSCTSPRPHLKPSSSSLEFPMESSLDLSHHSLLSLSESSFNDTPNQEMLVKMLDEPDAVHRRFTVETQTSFLEEKVQDLVSQIDERLSLDDGEDDASTSREGLLMSSSDATGTCPSMEADLSEGQVIFGPRAQMSEGEVSLFQESKANYGDLSSVSSKAKEDKKTSKQQKLLPFSFSADPEISSSSGDTLNVLESKSEGEAVNAQCT